jgi:O-antigen/teichoic acid export membrane protein
MIFFNSKFQIKSIANLLISYFNEGHSRTVEVKKNIFVLFIIKIFSIGISLAIVPVTINYLNPTKYGIWLTLSSIVGWFSFFDIGLGNGLRNKFTESIAEGNHDLARSYVSTTYASLLLIIGVVLIFFWSINPFLNWNGILNVSDEVINYKELRLIAFVLFTFFLISFLFKLITTILISDQKPAKAAFIDLFGQIISLFLILFLIKTTESSLLLLSISLTGAPIVILLFASFWLFYGDYRLYRPSIKFIDFNKVSHLLNLGFKFFIIQIAAVILYSTNNVIISQILGPEEVAKFNIVFKYFSLLMMLFTIFISPFWSSFTEAWLKKDLYWIQNIMKKLGIVYLFFIALGIFLFLISKKVFSYWVGNSFEISFLISFLTLCWIFVNIWNGIFSQFLYGAGKIQLQMYIAIITAILNIPLAIFLGNAYSLEGIILANILISSFGILIYPIQYFKLIQGKAFGIWNK